MTNSERISAEVQRINEDRERELSAAIRKHIQDIEATTKSIASMQARLVELRKSLSELSYQPMNAAEILGA